MKPIISPWLFYLMGISEEVGLVSLLIGIVLGIVTLIYFIIIAMCKHDNNLNKEQEKYHTRKIKKFTIAFIITIILEVALPSEETCYKMIAASLVTPNNIEAVSNKAEDIINYIVDSVDKIINEDN